MVCLNKKFYEKELADYASVLGSESAAYYVLAMNNGYTLDKDPDGKPSKLYEDILAACGNNPIRAIQEKSLYYTQAYIKANGDWTLELKEPSYNPALYVTSNTVSQDILQNDIFGEIKASLARNHVIDDEYAMRTAIERTRLEYIDLELNNFKDEYRKRLKYKTNAKNFFKKALAFIRSPFNFNKITDPSSDKQKASRAEAFNRFNETLHYLILESIQEHLVDGKMKDWFTSKRLENSVDEIKLFLTFLDVARKGLSVPFTNELLLSSLLHMLDVFEYDAYKDGKTLFKSEKNIIKALMADDISEYPIDQLDYILNFKNSVVGDFLSDCVSVISPEVHESLLMYFTQGYNSSKNQVAYDVMKSGLESRLQSIQNSKMSHGKDAVYQIKSKIQNLKKLNMYDTNDVFSMYYDFLDSAETEFRNAITYLEGCINGTRKMDASTLMYLQTNVLGYYEYIILNHIDKKLTTENSGLSSDLIRDVNTLNKMNITPLRDQVIQLYNLALDKFCDEVVDKFVEESCTLGDIENHKRVLKAALRNMIDNGEVSFGELAVGDANTSKSDIVRMIANKLNSAEREVNRDVMHRGRHLLALYKKAEGIASKLGINPTNFSKMFCEMDKDGMPTGNFVSGYIDEDGKYVGVNKGQFEKERREFEKQLRLEYGIPGDEHGNTIWNFDIKGQEDVYNKYMDRLDDWLAERANRMYTTEYYKQRRRILTRSAREKLEEIDAAIKIILEKCTDDEGFVFESDLTSGERALLHSLRKERDELGNPYSVTLDITGKIIKLEKKTGEALEIAESIMKWQLFIKGKVERKPDWTKYNEALAKITDPAKRAIFEQANTVTRLSDKFYERLAKCSTASQTQEYGRIASLRSKIMGYTKNSRGYVMPDLLRLNDEAWAELKSIDEQLNAERTFGGKGSENFDDFAQMYPVSMEDPSDPSRRITVLSYLESQAVANLSVNPNAMDEFYRKYYYEKRDKRGNKKLVPLSVFFICGPNAANASYKETVPANSYTEIVGGEFFNPEYDHNNPDSVQPKAKKYKNDKYALIMENDAYREFFLELLDMMEDGIKELPSDTNASVTKMPQITDEGYSIAARKLAKGKVLELLGAATQYFVANETDTDLYQEDLAKLPNGQFVETAPKRFISSLEDPTKICCDITKTVTMFYMMCKNYGAKSEINPEIEALISRMNGGVNGSSLEQSTQSQRAQLELEMYGYGRMQLGFGEKHRKMNKKERIATKTINTLKNAATIALLAGKVISAAKGFASAWWQTGAEAFVGKYYDFGDRFWATGKLLSELPKAVMGMKRGNGRSLIQALMADEKLASSPESVTGEKNKVWIRRMMDHFNMGPFTIGDYTINAIMLTSVYHATRLIPNPKHPEQLKFMTEEECIDMFYKNGMTEKEAIKWFEKHSGNHLMNMFEVDKDGNPVLKNKVKIKINGVEATVKPSDYVTNQVKNRAGATVEYRAAIANGTVSEHGKTRMHQGTLTKLILPLRNYLVSQGWDRLKSGDSFAKRYYDKGQTRSISEDEHYRGLYNYETGHCEPGVFTSLVKLMSVMEFKIRDAVLILPMIYKILKTPFAYSKLKRADKQNIKRLVADLVGTTVFMCMAIFGFLPMVKKYPDEWIWWALLMISGGAAMEIATSISITTVLDLLTTVWTGYSFLKEVNKLLPAIKDLFGLSDKSLTDYEKNGNKYKYKQRWWRDAMTLSRLTAYPGIAGYYETFTPAIPGVDNPKKSKYLKRQADALKKMESMDAQQLMSLEGLSLFSDVTTTPLGPKGVYSWYSGNSFPMTLIPSTKNEEKKENNSGSKSKRRHRKHRKTRKVKY